MTIEEKNYINLLEKIGSDVHPALEQQIVDGWICNFAEGYLNPACCGKGYGKILVKEILENACDMGAEKLCLQVVQENSVAINLYKSFGFEYLYTYWYMVKSN